MYNGENQISGLNKMKKLITALKISVFSSTTPTYGVVM